jgi:hypothetical protein
MNKKDNSTGIPMSGVQLAVLRRPETSGHRIPLFSCVVGYGSG